MTPNEGFTDGSGGSGYGGAIFVRSGGTLVMTGSALFDKNAALGGDGGSSQGAAGFAAGTDLYMMKGSSVILSPGGDNVITFNGSIADDSGTSSIADGNGASLTVQDGLVIFNGANTYSGQTIIATGGVLQAQDGTGISTTSNINFTGGVLQTNGIFDRFVGTASPRVQWTGDGGFAAQGGALEVKLSNNATLVWGAGSFVPNGNKLLFGSRSATDGVIFDNAINLGGATRTILVTANDATVSGVEANTDTATLDGVLSNGGLIVGDSTHTGILILNRSNTYTDGTTVYGGTLRESATGYLADTGFLTVDGLTAIFDLGADHSDKVGTITLDHGGRLTGSGTSALDSATSFEMKDGTVDIILSGTGILNKTTTGTVVLNNHNTYTGATTITAGTLQYGTSDAIASGTVTVNGASAELALGGYADTVGTVTLDGGGLISGSGTLTSTGSFEMKSGTVNAVLGGSDIALNKTTTGTVVLNNHNTYTGNTNVLAGQLILGSSTAPNLSPKTAVIIASGASLVVNNDNAVASVTSNGTISGNKTLTSPIYNLNDGAQVSAKLGSASTAAGSTLNTNGSVTISNMVAANTINILTGQLILAGADLLSHDATLGIASAAAMTLTGGDQTVANLNGSGQLTLNGYTLNVTNGGTYSGSVTSDGNLNKTGGGTLTLSGTNKFTQGTSVNSGTLTVTAGSSLSTADTIVNQGATLVNNGTINSNVLVNAGGTLQGSGNIGGNFTGNGTTAPGNSPGILTVTGNYTENGTLQIEVGGLSGAGIATSGYDQVVVGGQTILNPGTSILDLKQYNGYSLDKGQVITAIKGAPGSISGSFSAITSDMSKDVVFNRSTGQLIGTGLSTGTSTEELAMVLSQGDENVRHLVQSMKISDHQYAGGDFIPRLLQSGLSTQDIRVIGDRASPEAYAGLVDYAGHVALNYTSAIANLPSVSNGDRYAMFAGYTSTEGTMPGSVQNADYTIKSHGNLFGIRFNIEPNWMVSTYLGSDAGSVNSRYVQVRTKGVLYGLLAEYKPGLLPGLILSGGYAHADFDNSGSRETNGTGLSSPGQSRFTGIGSTADILSIGAKYQPLQLGSVHVQPEARISHVYSTVDAFSETNNASVLQALQLHKQGATALVTEITTSAWWPVTSQLTLRGKVALVHDSKSRGKSVTANVTSEAETFTTTTPGSKSTFFTVGAGLSYRMNEQVTFNGTYQSNVSGSMKSGRSLSVNAVMAF